MAKRLIQLSPVKRLNAIYRTDYKMQNFLVRYWVFFLLICGAFSHAEDLKEEGSESGTEICGFACTPSDPDRAPDLGSIAVQGDSASAQESSPGFKNPSVPKLDGGGEEESGWATVAVPTIDLIDGSGSNDAFASSSAYYEFLKDEKSFDPDNLFLMKTQATESFVDSNDVQELKSENMYLGRDASEEEDASLYSNYNEASETFWAGKTQPAQDDNPAMTAKANVINQQLQMSRIPSMR